MALAVASDRLLEPCRSRSAEPAFDARTTTKAAGIAAGLQGLDVADLWQGAGQGLAPDVDAKPYFVKAMLNVLGRVEGRLPGIRHSLPGAPDNPGR
jgi:hypothetical protein